MKSLIITLLFCSAGALCYAQSASQMPKSMQGHKNNTVLATSKNNVSANGTNSCSTKRDSNGSANAVKPEFSIISIIPTLRLWLLPGNFPNPFSKDED